MSQSVSCRVESGQTQQQLQLIETEMFKQRTSNLVSQQSKEMTEQPGHDAKPDRHLLVSYLRRRPTDQTLRS